MSKSHVTFADFEDDPSIPKSQEDWVRIFETTASEDENATEDDNETEEDLSTALDILHRVQKSLELLMNRHSRHEMLTKNEAKAWGDYLEEMNDFLDNWDWSDS